MFKTIMNYIIVAITAGGSFMFGMFYDMDNHKHDRGCNNVTQNKDGISTHDADVIYNSLPPSLK
jgi:hypothetical protein